MGTLGIITQLTLKVRPIPEAIGDRLGTVLEPEARRRARHSTNRERGQSHWSS